MTVADVNDLQVGAEWVWQGHQKVVTHGALHPRLTQREGMPKAQLAPTVVEDSHREQFDGTNVFGGRAEYEFSPNVLWFCCSPPTNRNVGP